jgi:hypothetical protein
LERLDALHWNDEAFDRQASLSAVKKTYAVATAVEEATFSTSDLHLKNYPNPFNSETIIEYSLPFDGNVKLEIYNAIGESVQTLVDEFQGVGNYKVMFNPPELSSGIFFYRIIAGNHTQLGKMIYLNR